MGTWIKSMPRRTLAAAKPARSPHHAAPERDDARAAVTAGTNTISPRARELAGTLGLLASGEDRPRKRSTVACEQGRHHPTVVAGNSRVGYEVHARGRVPRLQKGWELRASLRPDEYRVICRRGW